MPCCLPSPGRGLVFWNLLDPQAAETRTSYTARGVRAGPRRAHCWESPEKPSSFPFPPREGGQLWGQPRSGVRKILSLGGRRTRESGLAQSQVCLLRGLAAQDCGGLAQVFRPHLYMENWASPGLGFPSMCTAAWTTVFLISLRRILPSLPELAPFKMKTSSLF